MKSNDENIDYIFNEVASKTIKRYREEKNMSLEEVAKKMKTPISRQSLFKYENNQARMKVNIFMDICTALNVNANEAFKEINEQSLFLASKLSQEQKSPIDFNIFNSKDGASTIATAYATKEMMDEYINECEKSDLIENKESNLKNESEQLKQFRLLYDKMKDLPEESQKIIYNVTKSVMDQIDNQIDNKG